MKRKNLLTRIGSATWVVAAVGVASLGLLTHGNRAWREDTRRYVPLLDNIKEARVDLVTGHLWLEEMIAGDETVRPEKVWALFGRVDQAIGDCLAGTSSIPNLEGLVPTDRRLRGRLEQFRASVKGFRAAAEKRWDERETNGVGSPADQAFDEDFRELVDAAAAIDQSVHRSLGEIMAAQWRVHTAGLGLWGLLLVAACSGLQLLGARRARAEEAQRRSVQEVGALNTLNRRVSAKLPLKEVVDAALEGITTPVACDLALLFLRDGDALMLQGARSCKPEIRHEKTPVHRVGECMCGLAVRTDVPVYSRDIRSDPRCTWDECKKAGVRSFAALPLPGGDGVVGVLGLASMTERDFEAQGSFLETLSHAVAVGLQNSLLYEEVKRHGTDLEQRVADRTVQLQTTNERLEREIAEHRETQEELKRHRSHLEEMVNERTAALSTANESLRREVTERERAEAALRRLSSRQEAILAAVPDIIVEVDRDKAYTWSNPAGYEFFGEDVIGREAAFYFEGGQETYGVVQPLFEGDENVVYVESWQRRRDGAKRLLAWWCRVLKDAEGRVAGALSSARDITEQKQAEEARLAQVRFRESTDQIGRVMQRTVDLEQMMGNVLDALLSILRCDRAWLLFPCDPDASVYAVPSERTRPEYPGTSVSNTEVPATPGISAVLREALDSEDPVTVGPSSSMSVGPILKAFSVQSQMCMAVFPKVGDPWLFGVHQCSHPRVWTPEEKTLFKEVGHRIGDVLSSLLFLRQLQESETRFRSLVETAASVILCLAPDHTILEFNPEAERLYGCPRAEALGKDYMGEFLPEAVREVVAEDIWKVLAGGPARGFENTILTQDGDERILSWSVSRLTGQRGETTGIIAVGQDITEHKRAEEATRVAQERLLEQQRSETERVQTELDKARGLLVNQTRLATIGQMAASVAHELRNPLGAVRNAAYYLRRRAAGADPKFPEYLDLIEREVATADRVIRDMMNVARSEEPVVQTVDLGRTAREVIERACGARVLSEVMLDPEPFHVSANTGQLRQVLDNLLTNAVQAMEGKGTIRIEARRSAEWDTITVRDSGPGITAEHRDRLFEPLFTTKAKGTGLGLTICRQIVEHHGGTIDWVEGAGRGAAFRIRLPRHSEST